MNGPSYQPGDLVWHIPSTQIAEVNELAAGRCRLRLLNADETLFVADTEGCRPPSESENKAANEEPVCRAARGLIDPNEAPLRRPARDDRDLMIAATNGWVVAFDNLSGVRPDLADALCSLATGGGFATRALFTDDDEKLFSAMRPIMVNGIADLATRSDLLDRAISLTLPAIPDDRRRDEALLWRRYERVRPGLLGALLDAVSAGLRNLPDVDLDRLPRMADFVKWAVACAPALGWEPERFLDAYAGNRGAATSRLWRPARSPDSYGGCWMSRETGRARQASY
jgi:hypothetical protein